jgi:hypothetical protein
MVALPDADEQELLRNGRPTRYRARHVGVFGLERHVQLTKERKYTGYGVFWLGIIVDGCVYALSGEGIILYTVIGRGLNLCGMGVFGPLGATKLFYEHIVVTVSAVG